MYMGREGPAGFEADFPVALPLRERQNRRVHGEGAARNLGTEPEPYRRLKPEEFRADASRESQVANPRAHTIHTQAFYTEPMDRHLGPEIETLGHAYGSGQEYRAGQELALSQKILAVTFPVIKVDGPLTVKRDPGPAAADGKRAERSALCKSRR